MRGIARVNCNKCGLVLSGRKEDAKCYDCRNRARTLKEIRDRVKGDKKPNQKRKRSYKKKSGRSFYSSMPWRQVRYEVLSKYKRECMLCGASRKDGITLHVDHIKPRSTHPELELDIDNLQILCEDCNIGKGSRDNTDFR